MAGVVGMKKWNWWHALAGIMIAEAAGLIGSVFTMPAIPTWYAYLTKPALIPPSWVFGPVWTLLFVLMGLASYLVWREGWKKQRVKTAVWAYIVQLVINASWSVVFFGQQSPGAALVNIGFLWVMIVVTIWLFSRVSRAAAWMMAPYLAWVSFASYLNYAVWALN